MIATRVSAITQSYFAWDYWSCSINNVLDCHCGDEDVLLILWPSNKKPIMAFYETTKNCFTNHEAQFFCNDSVVGFLVIAYYY